MSDIERFTLYGCVWVRYDDHRAEVERLREERDEAHSTIYRLASERDKSNSEVERLTFERDQAQAEVKNLNAQMTDAIVRIRALTAERDEAQAEAERRLGDMQLLAKEIDLWKAAFPCSTPEQMLSEQRFMDARIHELRRERDGWRSDAERMTAERNEAQAEVERLRANGQAILDSSRPSDEDIWHQIVMTLLPSYPWEKATAHADCVLYEYRKRWGYDDRASCNCCNCSNANSKAIAREAQA